MKIWKYLLAALFGALFMVTPAHGQTVSASGFGVQDGTGAILASGQWCFSATCLSVSNGLFSGTISAGTQTVTVKNASAVTVMTVPNVTVLAGQPFKWNQFVVPPNTVVSGVGQPYLPCYVGSSYSGSSPTQTLYCQSFSGQLAWGSAVVAATSGILSGYGVPTFACVSPCHYTQVDAGVPSAALWNIVGPYGLASTNWVQSTGGGGPPSGNNFVIQLANLTGSALASVSAIKVDTSTNNLIAPQISGYPYAGPAQTGGGGNGIINSLGSNKTVIAEPTYAGETGLNWFNWNFSSANNYHLHRTLGGQDLDFFSNWVPSSAFFSNTDNPAHAYFFIDTTSSTTAKNIHAMGMDFNQYDTSPGYDSGSTGLLDAGWKSSTTLVINHNAAGTGITEGLSITQNKSGEGDTANYFYNNCTGGWTALSDEGCKALALQTNELACAYRGTIAASGTGLTSLATTPVTGNGCQGVGKMLIDIGQGGGLDVAPYSGTITNTSNVTIGSSGLTDVTLSGTVPVSNAWGTINANINPAAGSTSASPYTTSVTFNVTITSGVFDNTHVLCFFGGQHDCNIPTAVGTPSGGIVSITMPVRMSHPSGVPVMQGGLASSGLELPYYDYIAAGVKMRYLLDCIGSTTTTSARCTLWKQGNATGFGGSNAIPNDVFKSIPMTTLANSGTTTVSFNYTVANMPHPERFNLVTLLISGASDASFNTSCTGATFNVAALTGTCTIAGLSGTHTAASASAVPAGPQGTGINAYKIWPQARILDVQDYAATPIASNGKMLVEPNGITFASGDTLEVPNHESANFNGLTVANNPLNPYTQVANGIQVSMQGAGVTGITNLLSLTNNNGDALYQGFGGYLALPTMITTKGAFATGIRFDHLPTVYGSSDALINIPSIPTAQQNDTNLNTNLWFVAGKAGTYQQFWAPFTNTLTDSVTGPHLSTASNFTYTGTALFNTGIVINNGAGFSPQIGTNQMGFNPSAGQAIGYSIGGNSTTTGGWNLQSFNSLIAGGHVWINCPTYASAGTASTCTFNQAIATAGGATSTISATGNISTSAAIFGGFNTVTFSATPTFSATVNTNYLVLTGNVTSSTLAAGGSNQPMCFQIAQDATGGRTFVWPTNVEGAPAVNPTASAITGVCTNYNSTLSKWVATTGDVATVAAVTVAMPTSSISSGHCWGSALDTAATVSMPNLTTSMIPLAGYPSTGVIGITGWTPGGGIQLVEWPSAAGTMSWEACNTYGSAVAPGPLTLTFGATAR